jgi:Tol biopolymer transport system component
MGKEMGVLEESGSFQDLAISPDGSLVAISLDDPGPGRNIWLHDLKRGLRTRFTFANDAMDGLPRWSPDGKRIAYTSTEGGSLQLMVKETSGAGRAEPLLRGDGDAWPTGWHPDGKSVLFTTLTREATDATSADIMMATVGDESSAKPFLATGFQENLGSFSPDGRWVAYTSNESGRTEVYVTSFPEPAGKWQISSAGGDQPKWSHDGRQIYYLAPGDQVISVAVDGRGSGFQVGRESELFAMDINTNNWGSYDVSPDGSRFLIVVPLEQITISPATLVLNWESALGQ